MRFARRDERSFAALPRLKGLRLRHPGVQAADLHYEQLKGRSVIWLIAQVAPTDGICNPQKAMAATSISCREATVSCGALR